MLLFVNSKKIIVSLESLPLLNGIMNPSYEVMCFFFVKRVKSWLYDFFLLEINEYALWGINALKPQVKNKLNFVTLVANEGFWKKKSKS